VRTELVPLDRLDVLVGDRVAQARAPFSKIDTQGFEKPVLDGAGGCLDLLVGVEI